MENNLIAVIIAIVAIVPGVLGLVLQYRKDKNEKKKAVADEKKIKAEAADIVTDTAMSLITPLKAEIDSLRSEVKELKGENEQLKERLDDVVTENTLLRRWAKELVLQVIGLGGTPCPEPIPPKKKLEKN